MILTDYVVTPRKKSTKGAPKKRRLKPAFSYQCCAQSQLIPARTPIVIGRMGPKKCEGKIPPLAL